MTADDRLPGDPSAEAEVARMIRVDHAGEYGAARIYAGQLAVLGAGPAETCCATCRSRRSGTSRRSRI